MPSFRFETYQPQNTGSIIDLIARQGQIRANALRDIGNANAREAEASGQRAANLAGSLGNIIAGTTNQLADYYQVEKPKQEAATQAERVNANLSTLLSRKDPPTRDEIMATGVDAERGLKIAEGLQALQTPTTDPSQIPDKTRKILLGYGATPESWQREHWDTIRNEVIRFGGAPDDYIPKDYDAGWVKAHIEYAQQPAAPKLQSVDPTKPIVDMNTGQTVREGVPAPEKVTFGQPVKALVNGKDQFVRAGSDGQVYDLSGKALDSASVAPPKTDDQGFMSQILKGTNPHAIAEGIRTGKFSPDIGEYSRYTKDQIASDLAESGFDLSRAYTDWKATQKHIATLNGTQQTRLMQSINALPELLDTVDSLSSQWHGGRFPPLNKANLAAAKNGVYGDEVASVARKLDQQIADVTADLGQVYMGGNSPTDHSLELAGTALKSDWSEKVLKDMVDLARKNVQIRRNSINNTGVAGASPDNPYAPPKAGGADDQGDWIDVGNGIQIRPTP